MRILLVAGSSLGAVVVLQVAIFADALGHGPYTTWYNNKCLRLAQNAQLVGRPETEISAVLGPPSYVWDYGDVSGRRKTYNYDPLGLATGIFQVHCRDGVVKGLEQFDD
jgi:hypothetical protein